MRRATVHNLRRERDLSQPDTMGAGRPISGPHVGLPTHWREAGPSCGRGLARGRAGLQNRGASLELRMSTAAPIQDSPQHAAVIQVRAGSMRARMADLHRGFCIASPRLGERLVMYNENGRQRIVTTPVRRVLEAEGCVYVQTVNSTYRLEPATSAEIDAAIVDARSQLPRRPQR